MKIFGGNRCIMFCSETNEDIENKLWAGASFEDIFEKNKDEINLVRYDEIEKFHYDENDSNGKERHKIYTRTILIDDFRDFSRGSF